MGGPDGGLPDGQQGLHQRRPFRCFVYSNAVYRFGGEGRTFFHDEICQGNIAPQDLLLPHDAVASVGKKGFAVMDA